MIMDLLLNIGIIGLVLLFIMCFFTLRKYKMWGNPQYIFIIAYIMYFSLHGLSERAFDTFNYSTLLFFAALGIGTLDSNIKCTEA